MARLGLLDDDGAPRVLPVTYALAQGALVSAIDDKPKHVAPERLARVRWLRARPRAALTVDHYEDDWSRLAWVQAIGAVNILDAAEGPDIAIVGLAEASGIGQPCAGTCGKVADGGRRREGRRAGCRSPAVR